MAQTDILAKAISSASLRDRELLPRPWFFVTIPAEQSRDLKAISGFVTYGWGVIPVHVRTGKTE